MSLTRTSRTVANAVGQTVLALAPEINNMAKRKLNDWLFETPKRQKTQSAATQRLKSKLRRNRKRFNQARSSKKKTKQPKLKGKKKGKKLPQVTKRAIERVIDEYNDGFHADGTLEYEYGGHLFNTDGKKRVLFSSPYTTGGVTASGIDYNLFSPLRYLDAVSILYNEKAPTVDYTVTTDNFSTDYTKLRILDSRATVWFKNNSQMLAILEVYEFAPKVNLDDHPLTSWSTLVTKAITDGFYKGIPATMSLNDLKVRPTETPGLKDYWTIKKKLVVLEPGKTRTLKYVGARNTDIEFQGMFDIDGNPTFRYVPGFTLSLVVGVHYQPTVDSTGALIYPKSAGVGTDEEHHIATKVYLKFKVKAPEQTEDQRNRDRGYYFNYVTDGSTTHTANPLVNKLQPATVISDPKY